MLINKTDRQRAEKQIAEEIAKVLWQILIDLDIQDGYCKSYDPLTIERNIAHSYVFDLEDGGRHHHFKDIPDLIRMMKEEVVREIQSLLRQKGEEVYEECATIAESVNDCCDCDDEKCCKGKDCLTAKAIRKKMKQLYDSKVK